MIEKERVLVTYFSWSGNTREVANQIHQFVGGDIFEIQPVEDYPANYNTVLDITKQEIRSGYKPELKGKPASVEEYSIIFIGYPNWWGTFPAPVLTFLSDHSFSGKTIIPFCTHGGGGIGRSVSDLAKQCDGAEIRDSFSINGNAVRNNNEKVEKWLKKVINTSIS